MDGYVEQLIEKRKTAKDQGIRAALIGICAVLLIGGFLTGLLIPAVLIVCLIYYFGIRNLDIEYEYLFVNGDFTVDKIVQKAKRKQQFNCGMDRIEVVCPLGEAQTGGQKLPEKKYCSGAADAKVYEMVINTEKGRMRVLFEPNQDMLKAMHSTSPRKVRL